MSHVTLAYQSDRDGFELTIGRVLYVLTEGEVLELEYDIEKALSKSDDVKRGRS